MASQGDSSYVPTGHINYSKKRTVLLQINEIDLDETELLIIPKNGLCPGCRAKCSEAPVLETFDKTSFVESDQSDLLNQQDRLLKRPRMEE